jgi:hypothetical protein
VISSINLFFVISLTTSGEIDNVLNSVYINLINIDVDWKLITFKIKSQIILTRLTFFD